MDPILIAFLGYIAGAVFRTLYDFLWKSLDNPDFSFDSKYWVTMILSVILSIISAMVTFTTIQIPTDTGATVFLISVTTGFMMNHLVNKPVDYLSKKKAG